MPTLGIAGEDIPINSLCCIGGSSKEFPLVTLLGNTKAANIGISLEDAYYGDFISLLPIGNIINKNNKGQDVNDKVTTVTTYTGSVITIWGGVWSMNDIAIFSGVAIAVLSFLYNMFCKERQHKADMEYKQALLQEIKSKTIVSIANEMANVGKEDNE